MSQNVDLNEILIIADTVEKYGENWIICLTRRSYEEQLMRFQNKLNESELSITAEASEQPENSELSSLTYEEHPMIAKEWNSASMDDTIGHVNALNVQSSRPLVCDVGSILQKIFVC